MHFLCLINALFIIYLIPSEQQIQLPFFSMNTIKTILFIGILALINFSFLSEKNTAEQLSDCLFICFWKY